MSNRVKIRLISSIIAIVIALVVPLVLTKCQRDKTFSAAGMSITLTTKFKEKDYIAATSYYESNNAIVVTLKEEFELFEQDYTVEQYAYEVIAVNDVSSQAYTTDNYVYFTYTATVSGKNYYYYATCHKSNDAYWLIQFACEAEDKDDFQDDFEKWANSVVFE